MDINEIRNRIKESTFCYAKKEGEGFTKKIECQCYLKGIKNCKAVQEREHFINKYDELESQGLSRKEIIKHFEEYYKNRESYWYKQNVIY